MSLQKALKLLRLELGVTQDDLARKLNKTCLTVNRWENGKGFPSRNSAREILDVAKQCGASDECISYLHEVLMPEAKRAVMASAYGFPDIERDFLLQLTDGAAGCIYVIDAETYNILYANRKAETAAARYLSELGESTGERRLTDQEDKRCFHYFANKSAPCSFCPLNQFGSDGLMDKFVTVPVTGRTMHINAKAEKIQGREVYVLYLMDVTENEAERDALYEMTNDIPEGVGIYHLYPDDNIQLVFMNTVLFQMIGEERQEALLKNELSGFCLIHSDDRERLIAEIRDAIHLKRNVEIDMRMRVRDHKYHPIHLSARMIKKDYDKFTFYCLFHEQDRTSAIEAGKRNRKEEKE